MPRVAAPTTWGNPFLRLRSGLAGEMLAEYFGTFMLVLLGDGSVAVSVVGLPGSGRQTLHLQPFGPANWLIIVWGWAFGVTFGVYVAGGVTGAHINPAVTLSFALRRGFSWVKVVPYWFAQVAGAFTGAALVYAVYYPAINWYNGTYHETRPGSLNTFAIFGTFPASYFHGAWAGPFIDQVVGTAILVALIAAIIDRRNQAPQGNIAALIVGLVVAVIGLAYGVNAGYAINPARDFGPRLFAWAAGWGRVALPGSYSWFSGYWWIPIAGPLAGGMAGILLYDFFIGQVLAARAKPPGAPPPEPGLAGEPQPAGQKGAAAAGTGDGEAQRRARQAARPRRT
jgi:glycerol uptake facilitator protein